MLTAEGVIKEAPKKIPCPNMHLARLVADDQLPIEFGTIPLEGVGVTSSASRERDPATIKITAVGNAAQLLTQAVCVLCGRCATGASRSTIVMGQRQFVSINIVKF